MQVKRLVSVVGCHAEGEVGDVIIGGVLPPSGDTMFDKMETMERDFDGIRQFLICEPRGSVARHVNLLVPSTRNDCDVGMIIMEPTVYAPMSGSNSICTVTVLLETGILPMLEPETIVRLDTPAGPVRALARCKNGKCLSVEIANVPSFVDKLDASVEVEGIGTIILDTAFGGMFFAIVDATQLGFAIAPDEARDLAIVGEKIRRACRDQLSVVHPGNPSINGVSIVQLNQPFAGIGKTTRNTCIVSPGRSDRSPTGTGTSARMAVLCARGQMEVGDEMVHESIIGSKFRGRILSKTAVGNRPAIVPAIEGRAWITGFMSYVVDPSDPWPEGYRVSDTWGVTGSLSMRQ